MKDSKKTTESSEQKNDIYEARYHTEMTVDADSATDEEWAAACKAADHRATFATYEEAETFIREGKAAAGESFEGGHINKNGGIVKQVRAISPTLEEMSAKVTDLLSEIDDAKSKGNNAGARELERQLGKVHQNYYYSIVHFGVDISGEQFEFAFKHAVVEYSAKKEMARRNSEEYKAAVRAEAEYDAKKASAIIKANANVSGIEYVEEVKKLLGTAILSWKCGDIVYYYEELKRILAKMPETLTITEETVRVAAKSEEEIDNDGSNDEPEENEFPAVTIIEDSDAVITTLSTLAFSALAALYNVIKTPESVKPAEPAEEVPAVQPVEKAASDTGKSKLDATREKIAKTQDAIKKNTRRLMKLDAKVHGLGTELDFYETAFSAALDDSAIETYSDTLDELTHIASQIGGKLIDKAKAETTAATLRTRIAKATARLEKLSSELASLESDIATAA